MANVDLSLKHL